MRGIPLAQAIAGLMQSSSVRGNDYAIDGKFICRFLRITNESKCAEYHSA